MDLFYTEATVRVKRLERSGIYFGRYVTKRSGLAMYVDGKL